MMAGIVFGAMLIGWGLGAKYGLWAPPTPIDVAVCAGIGLVFAGLQMLIEDWKRIETSAQCFTERVALRQAEARIEALEESTRKDDGEE